MITAIASGILCVLFGILTNNIIDELKKIMGSNKCTAVMTLQTTIMQAENLLKQVDTIDLHGEYQKVIQDTVDKLTALCYDTEDIMFDISCMIRNAQGENQVRKRLSSIISELQTKLDAILEALDGLVKLPSKSAESQTGRSSGNGKPDLEMAPPQRMSDVEEIIQELISDKCDYNGVSIVGMNGLGKTMVARSIENDARVVAHFSARLWVDGVGGFDAKQIINKVNELHVGSSNNCEADCQGHGNLLIVFDNFLEVKLVEWNTFWLRVNENKGINGKRYKTIKFLITTVNKRVVDNTRTRIHYLNPMSEEMCKEVILATARSHNKKLTDTHSEHAGLLAERCGGLPIVATILGVYLAQYTTKQVSDTLTKDLWGTKLFKEEIFPSLKPCYAELQSHLKRCLAYFSLFTQNCSFSVDDLMQLWIGEGFIHETEGTLSMLQTAEDHFTYLLGRSIIRQSSKPETPNEMTKYELNQFGLKFAQYAASKTYLKLAQDVAVYDNNTRHLSYTNIDSVMWGKLKRLKGLRTLLSINRYINSTSNISQIPDSLFKILTRLRVLSLSQTDVSKLPTSIQLLKQLHYLDISHTLIEKIPNELCKLHTLQFLKLVKPKGNVECLPKDFQNLTNMIYLDWGISDIRHMGLPRYIGKLHCLQTLPIFLVGDYDGYLITELKDMNHLQGSILISNLEKVRDRATAEGAKLCDKSYLKGLELEWKKSCDVIAARVVLRGLKPHQNLKKLKITNYPGDVFPDWMDNSLLELEEMHLCRCSNIKVFPKHMRLPKLKRLVIEDMKWIENGDQICFGDGNFPELETLTIKSMEEVQGCTIGVDANAFPSLYALTFVDCPMLTNVSSLKHLPLLVELTFENCGALKTLPDLPISLKSLILRRSSLLSTRYREEDWPKVSCLENLEIDYQKIITQNDQSNVSKVDEMCSPWEFWSELASGKIIYNEPFK